jgi:hypothetical protein
MTSGVKTSNRALESRHVRRPEARAPAAGDRPRPGPPPCWTQPSENLPGGQPAGRRLYLTSIVVLRGWRDGECSSSAASGFACAMRKHEHGGTGSYAGAAECFAGVIARQSDCARGRSLVWRQRVPATVSPNQRVRVAANHKRRLERRCEDVTAAFVQPQSVSSGCPVGVFVARSAHRQGARRG